MLDADALNMLAELPEWWAGLYGEAVVTPHPGEMSRLTGLSTAEVNAHRMVLAEQYAAQWGVTVVLKGAYTVVASPEGSVRVSPFANPALATAGSGDVLAGVIAGLVAQGASPFDAAACGVYLHGAAGEQARQAMGDAGVLAGDLLPLLPLGHARHQGGRSALDTAARLKRLRILPIIDAGEGANAAGHRHRQHQRDHGRLSRRVAGRHLANGHGHAQAARRVRAPHP